MAWKKASAEVAAFLEEVVAPFRCERKPMFGHPVYFVNGNMFAGLYGDGIFVRLSEQDQGAMRATWDETTNLAPMPDRPMREYVMVPDSLCADRSAFGEWLERSYQYTLSLPPKPAKEPKRKR
jgi:TfoX/Sxy family transcriptional regulator of competence genes